MIFHISLSDKSTRFLSSGDLKSWTTAEDRGFTDDQDSALPQGVTEATKMNKIAKASLLTVVLGSIAGYAPVISPKFIKRQSTSLDSIWNRLRAYYGFRCTGSRVLDLMDIKLEANESREGLWERMFSFIEDQLLTKDGEVKHEGATITTNEELTPTLLNVLITTWLHVINPALPSLIKQRFATQLRSCTLYTIREEISEAIPTLLSELEDKECNISRAGAYQRNMNTRYRGGQSYQYSTQRGGQSFQYSTPRGGQSSQYSTPKRSCCLCEAKGRPSNHFLSTCPFLPPDDKKYMSKTREVSLVPEDDTQLYDDTYDDDSYPQYDGPAPIQRIDSTLGSEGNIRRVDVFASPVLEVSIGSKISRWTLDSGAEANVISIAECNRLGLKIIPTAQAATQGDGKTPLPTYGEVHFVAERGHHTLKFSGLVVKHLDTPVLAGMPFHRVNHIQINYSLNYIVLEDCCKISFDPEKAKKKSVIKALRISRTTCILPGERASFQLPPEYRTKDSVAVEPRTTVPKDMPDWLRCCIVSPDAEGSITIKNTSTEPVLLSKHTQVCQVRPTVETDSIKSPSQPSEPHSPTKPNAQPGPPRESAYSQIDIEAASHMSKSERTSFNDIHKEFNSVFTPGIGCYNNYSGKFEHYVNISENLPPQRKGRVPDYSRGDKELLQQKFDELLAEGVLSRAEDVDQPIEYVHPSFLIKKA